MKNITEILENEISRFKKLLDTFKFEIENFDTNYETEINQMLLEAENFDTNNIIIPDNKTTENKRNFWEGTSSVVQGSMTDIGTYLGAFQLVTGSIGLIGKGLKNLFKSNPKIHISKIPTKKIENAYESHKIKTDDKKPYLLVDNGDDGLSSVLYSKKGISIANSNLNKNYFFDWNKIKTFELKQLENGVFIYFNETDNINLKYFYDGKQSQLGLLFYIAQSIKLLNEKPKELKNTIPKIKDIIDKLSSAKTKINQNENIIINEYTEEYDFKNINSLLFYKMQEEDIVNFVLLNYYKFIEVVSKNIDYKLDDIISLIKNEFNTDIIFQDVDKKTRDSIQNKLFAIGTNLSKYIKIKEFIQAIDKFKINKNTEINEIYKNIQKEQIDKQLFLNIITELEEERTAYLERKRKKQEMIAFLSIVFFLVLLGLFIWYMNS